MEVISIDLLQLLPHHEWSHYTWVCIDHFSHFVILAPLETKLLEAVAHALITDVFCLFSMPLALLSERSAEFKNYVLKVACKILLLQLTILSQMVEMTNKKIGSITSYYKFYATFMAGLVSSCCSFDKFFSLLFGTDMRLPYDVLSQPPSPVSNVDGYTIKQANVFAKNYMHHMWRWNHSNTSMQILLHMWRDVVMKLAWEHSSKLSAKFL